MKYTDSNISFNNVSKVGAAFGALGNGGLYNVTAAEGKNPDFVLTDDKIPSKAINAIDIDWNGAQVNGDTINTTGELLAKIADLETLVRGLYASLELDNSGN